MDLVGRIYADARKRGELEAKRSYTASHFHASESGDCKRELALRRTIHPRERFDEPSSLLRLQDGHVHHSAVREIIRGIPGITLTNIEHDEILFVELEGYPPFVVTGHCDGHLHDSGDPEAYVLEVKGLNRFSFQKLKSEQIDTLREVYPKAIPQARMYMGMMEKEKALILIKNKDTSELKQFTLEHDEKKYMKLIMKFAEISKLLGQKDLPLCDFLKGSKQCRFCNYPSLCGR